MEWDLCQCVFTICIISRWRALRLWPLNPTAQPLTAQPIATSLSNQISAKYVAKRLDYLREERKPSKKSLKIAFSGANGAS